MRFPGMREIWTVALLISYNGRLPNVKLRNMMRRTGVAGRATKSDGSANGSAAGYHANRIMRYLRAEGLVRFEGNGSDAEYVATVSLGQLAAWLADALATREAYVAAKDAEVSDAAV